MSAIPESAYASPIPEEWKSDIAGYREMLAASDRAAHKAALAEQLHKRKQARREAIRCLLTLPKDTPGIIEERVQRLMKALDERDRKEREAA
jgi:hypothetical protein